MAETMTIKQIEACIKVSDRTFAEATDTLLQILKERKPYRAYHYERLTTSIRLCDEIVRNRARLVELLQKAQADMDEAQARHEAWYAGITE